MTDQEKGPRVIWKFSLDPDTMPPFATQHSMPPDARFLDLQVQDGVPVMWWSLPRAETHSKGPGSRSHWKLRTFVTAPTGPPGYTDNLHYVGSFQLEGGAFVGHLFSFEPIPREER